MHAHAARGSRPNSSSLILNLGEKGFVSPSLPLGRLSIRAIFHKSTIANLSQRCRHRSAVSRDKHAPPPKEKKIKIKKSKNHNITQKRETMHIALFIKQLCMHNVTSKASSHDSSMPISSRSHLLVPPRKEAPCAVGQDAAAWQARQSNEQKATQQSSKRKEKKKKRKKEKGNRND